MMGVWPVRRETGRWKSRPGNESDGAGQDIVAGRRREVVKIDI